MAALLPGSKLELIPGDDDVRLDGLSTKGALARQKVLNQNSRVEATVLSAKDLLEMNTDEGRAAVQPYRLIYIYHNVIDAIGDQASSERQVLSACKTAISELLRLVKKFVILSMVQTLSSPQTTVFYTNVAPFKRQTSDPYQVVSPPPVLACSQMGEWRTRRVKQYWKANAATC